MRLKEAKRRGARVVVLDPFRAPVADLADRWLCPPGTDVAIGLAMIDTLILEQRYDATLMRNWCHGFASLAERAARYAAARADRPGRSLYCAPL